ncbi:MAG TPA: caspase family protein [Pyrinomonadaceae bacterium]|nr:caspase family protein [Pyrinomonadaceae bacterium]
MKATRPFPLLCVVVLLCVSVMPPTGARTQDAGGSGSTAKAGRYHALVIGNNVYKNVPHLKTAENDARAVKAILREQYGFQTRLLLNATRQQIIAALNSYRRELDADANLLIYYAGHGVNDKEIDKAYWLPVDADRDDNSNWISADDITSNIKGIPAKHVMIVSDSCYSGTLTRGLDVISSVPAIRERYLQKMAAGRSRTLMASGGNEPVADEGGVGNHSVFASALMRGLRQTEKNEFTAAELYREFVEETVAGRASQTPEYSPLRNSGHESGDFVFVRVKTADGKIVEVTVKAPTTGTFDPAAVELSFWETIKNSTASEDFKEYLEKYPNGQFAGLARRRISSPPNPESANKLSNSDAPVKPAGLAGLMWKNQLSWEGSGITMVVVNVLLEGGIYEARFLDSDGHMSAKFTGTWTQTSEGFLVNVPKQEKKKTPNTKGIESYRTPDKSFTGKVEANEVIISTTDGKILRYQKF